MDKIIGIRSLVAVKYYTTDKDEITLRRFLAFLSESGFEVITKQSIYNKNNFDVEITADAMKMSSKYDVLVLMTGDGDFHYLLQEIKRRKKKVEVASFSANLSGRLKTIADVVHVLNENVITEKIPIENNEKPVIPIAQPVKIFFGNKIELLEPIDYIPKEDDYCRYVRYEIYPGNVGDTLHVIWSGPIERFQSGKLKNDKEINRKKIIYRLEVKNGNVWVPIKTGFLLKNVG